MLKQTTTEKTLAKSIVDTGSSLICWGHLSGQEKNIKTTWKKITEKEYIKMFFSVFLKDGD